jgi:hypothetical protein
MTTLLDSACSRPCDSRSISAKVASIEPDIKVSHSVRLIESRVFSTLQSMSSPRCSRSKVYPSMYAGASPGAAHQSRRYPAHCTAPSTCRRKPLRRLPPGPGIWSMMGVPGHSGRGGVYRCGRSALQLGQLSIRTQSRQIALLDFRNCSTSTDH